MQPVKNQEYDVEISGYNSDGAGVARINGQVVFVPGVIRGEICKIKILKVNKNIAYGKLVSVEKASPFRIESACEVFPKCGGCDFWHMAYEEELRFKEEQVQNVITRIGGLDLKVETVVGAKNTFHYRNKAQFPVGKSGGCVCGFYRTHSHDIVPCDDCKIQSHFANAVAQTVLSWMSDYGIEPYEEKTGKGVVRHIYVRNTMLCLIVTKKPAMCDELIARVKEKHPETSGILLNYNKENTNVILGKTLETLYGETDVIDTLCGNVFAIAPHAFYQVNHDQAETLYGIAIEKAKLTGDETVLDLYCGAGTITLALARHAKKVIGVEIIPQAVENARENAKLNGIENAEFICGDATKAAETLKERNVRADVVVVDPPRKGLTPDLIKTIGEIAPKRVVYVSCDPATLARDLKLFEEIGYETKTVTPVDMFPRTRHCECVALLSK
ncbi:MAG: 23S rRNA (uracil(1939)-C(5))-methyltransferase RlmD [Clostridia bacterium]|nr:23S rRNA (uracil(1939)-C(5))-methyltransferase RlmD [Clostridia bacterium]